MVLFDGSGKQKQQLRYETGVRVTKRRLVLGKTQARSIKNEGSFLNESVVELFIIQSRVMIKVGSKNSVFSSLPIYFISFRLLFV